MLGLRCWVGFLLVAASRGYSLLMVCRLLIAAASPWGSRLLQGGDGAQTFILQQVCDVNAAGCHLCFLICVLSIVHLFS